MPGDENVLLSINNTKMRIGNVALVDVKGKGTISLNMRGSGKKIHDVLYVPDLEKNFLVLVNS